MLYFFNLLLISNDNIAGKIIELRLKIHKFFLVKIIRILGIKL
jgi:hypothetical protein